MKKLLQGDALEKRARDLGVDTEGPPITHSTSGRQRRVDDAELQKRVLEAERSRRESQLWLLALISALAALVSATAAWWATLRK
jgi:hypothetical protein